jgi:DNA-binding beta-propeller fold protein YncE
MELNVIKLISDAPNEEFIEVTEAIMRQSATIENLIRDLGIDQILANGIAVPNSNLRLLTSVSRALSITDKKHGYNDVKNDLKTLFEKLHFDNDNIVEFVRITDFLDIPNLFRPAVAIWVETFRSNHRGWTLDDDIRKALENKLSNELIQLSIDHLKLKDNLASIIKQRKTIKARPTHLRRVDNKLYVANFENTIQIFSLATHELLKTIPTEGTPKAMLAVGSILYIANAPEYEWQRKHGGSNKLVGSGNLTVIDTTTDRVLHCLKPSGFTPIALARGSNDVIYIANDGNDQILTFDIDTSELQAIAGRIMKEPPQSLASVGKNLYIIEEKFNKVFILDTDTKTLQSHLMFGPNVICEANTMITIDSNLYIATRTHGLLIFDTTTKRKKSLNVLGVNLFASGNRLFVSAAYHPDGVAIFHIPSNRDLGYISLNNLDAEAILGDILYVGDFGEENIKTYDLSKFNYYSDDDHYTQIENTLLDRTDDDAIRGLLFFHDGNRESAHKLLNTKEDGSYVLRPSSVKGKYAISIKVKWNKKRDFLLEEDSSVREIESSLESQLVYYGYRFKHKRNFITSARQENAWDKGSTIFH